MKREKSILTRAREAIKHSNAWHEDQIAGAKKRRLPLYKLARQIQPILNGQCVTVSSYSIDIDCRSISDSRTMVAQILENTAIKEFKITMEKSWSEKLLWHYKGTLNEIKVFVGPAPASKGCTPVLKASANTYWICERK